MFSRYFFLSVLISFGSLSFITAEAVKKENKSHRRLIILSDETEHVGKASGALTGNLIGALQSAESSILVSVSLWQNIMEKAESLSSGALLGEKEEQFACECAQTILSMLNADENSIDSIGSADPIMAKQIIVDRINAALEKLKKESVKDSELSARVLDYLRCFQLKFNTNEYNLYKVNNCYYLVTPKKLSSGLVTDGLEFVTDQSNIDWVYFNDTQDDSFSLLDALKKIFISAKDTSYIWDIYLNGHGGNGKWYQKNCPNLSKIAGMTPAKFKEVLQFFESSVATNSFWYQTCEGGGLHMQDVVNGNDQHRIFPIVCLCLTDTYSYGYLPGVAYSLAKGILSAYDIEFNVRTGKWKLVLPTPQKWKEFFSTIEDNSFDGNELAWISKAAKSIATNDLENTPLLLRPGSKDIITIYPDSCLRLSKEYCDYLENASREVYVDTERITVILLDTPKLNTPCNVTSAEVPLLISVMPGRAVHHLTKIVAKESFVEHFVKMFKPLKGITFDKTFVIDEVTCKLNPEKKYGPFLQADEHGITTLKDVVITHNCDKLTRFFFKNSTGDLFKAYTTCTASCNDAELHGFKQIEDEKVKEAFDVYRNKLISE